MIDLTSASRVFSLAVLLAALAPAQGPTPPRILGGMQHPPGLNPPAVPATEVLQIQLVRLSSDPFGTWTVALSVRGLAAAWGGRGGGDLLLGRYDAVNDRFVPSTAAAACNTAGTEFGGMLDARGLNLVFERDGRITHARRPAVALAFGVGQQVANVPENTRSYYDPSLGSVDGDPVLFYHLDGQIRMDLFDPAASALFGPSVTVVQPRNAAAEANSPTPLFDRAGEVHGLLHHDLVGSDNDMYLTLDLDPTTPSHLLLDTPTWLNNGGFAGGKFFSAENAPSPYHVIQLEAVWMSGCDALIDRTATLDFFVPPAPADVSVSFLLMGTRYAATSIPIPGIGGSLGLDPAALALTLPVGTHDAASGQATFAMQVPNDPGLFGVQIPVQGLTQTVGRGWSFTNTSSLRVAPRTPPRTVVLPYDGADHVVVTAVDPDRPALTVKLQDRAPLPIELIALDLRGVPLGSPLAVDPGWMNTISTPGAANYAVRMPFGSGTAAIVLQDGDGGWKPHTDSMWCGTQEWRKLKLPKGKVCVKMQPKHGRNGSDCPVEWQIMSRTGTTWFTEDAGTLDPAQILYSQRCVAAPPGADAIQVEWRCPTGAHPSECRLTVMFREVDDCAKCASEDKRPAR
jgi:hypothetical protein